MKTFLAVCIALQLLFLVVLNFGNIGFDKPGRFGLSFGHGILFAIFYLAALLAGITCAIKIRRWKTLLTQLGIPLLIVAISYWPVPSYSATNYQHLVGKSKSEVQSVLSSRLALSGFQGGANGNFGITSYKGMTVFYDENNTVVKVVENNR